ncbi:SMP-30/gluconolactonase/LRE family protein [Tomitella biformata]|uniref:SMP-30/gluconolactonase/LRE family protein n=1 Tax=Tomitella biformata TaxID=630403 RepID=UPI00046395B7|nr:SMP-30/gluconolactonase/LRE family protein [Tomitella biformata]
MTTSPQTVLDGLCFPECPRWRDGALWFSDIFGEKVIRLDPRTGEAAEMAHIPGGPGGLGFLPDGDLLIAGVKDRKVYRRTADGTLSVHADLADLATWHLNDMFTDHLGRTYVGNYGDASSMPTPPRPASLVLIEPDGSARAVGDPLLFANGIAPTRDGRRLFVAETRSAPGRISTFAVAADGALSGRQTLREFGSMVFPDGIAVDTDDNIWVASPATSEVILIDGRDGHTIRTLSAPRPFAVALGGEAGEHLYVCASEHWDPATSREHRSGRILRIDLG